MVDAEDLKSFGYCNRVGSSPTIPTTDFHYAARGAKLRKASTIRSLGEVWLFKYVGCVAQLVRALRSHRRGR